MSNLQQLLTKLHRLKQQVSQAPDFLALDKLSEKVKKIRGKIGDDNRSGRELILIMDKIDQLIKEKNRYFKQRIIKKSDKLMNETLGEADRTLKYSKSAENLNLGDTKKSADSMTVVVRPSGHCLGSRKNIEQAVNATENRPKSIKNVSYKNILADADEHSELLDTASLARVNSANNFKKINKTTQNIGNSLKNIAKAQQIQDAEDAEKTTFNVAKNNLKSKRSSEEVDLLQQKLSFSFQKIQDLTKKVQELQNSKVSHTPMTSNYLQKYDTVVDQYTQKLRQKSFVIEDLKAKLQYFKSMNEQLKSRLLNQQRKSQDYIAELKGQIKSLRKQVEKCKKDNEDLQADVEQLENKNDGLLSQVKKLVNKLEEQTKDKQKMKKNITASSNTVIQELQDQIKQMSHKINTLSKLQIKIEQQQEEKAQIASYKNKLNQRISELEAESKKYQGQRDRYELELYKMQQQNRFLRDQLKANISAKEMLAEQLLNLRETLDQQTKLANFIEYEKDLKTKNKLNKLKEIKGLLTELK